MKDRLGMLFDKLTLRKRATEAFQKPHDARGRFTKGTREAGEAAEQVGSRFLRLVLRGGPVDLEGVEEEEARLFVAAVLAHVLCRAREVKRQGYAGGELHVQSK